MSKPIPTGITADREAKTLTISWDTGESFDISFDLLRNSCPCAQCMGGHENMMSEPDEDVFLIPIMSADATKLVDIKATGSYAITITWADGHATGIYTWHFLYTLCKMIEGEQSKKEE